MSSNHRVGVSRATMGVITRKGVRDEIGQMQVTTMRGRKEWMPLIVMQQDECPTAQDFA